MLNDHSEFAKWNNTFVIIYMTCVSYVTYNTGYGSGIPLKKVIVSYLPIPAYTELKCIDKI